MHATALLVDGHGDLMYDNQEMVETCGKLDLLESRGRIAVQKSLRDTVERLDAFSLGYVIEADEHLNRLPLQQAGVLELGPNPTNHWPRLAHRQPCINATTLLVIGGVCDI